MRRLLVFVLLVLVATACGGSKKPGAVRIGGPSSEPGRVAVRTLEPGPTPTPTLPPTPTPTPGPTPTPIPPPAGSTVTSQGGTQEGAPASFCWSEQVGGRTRCRDYAPPTQPGQLVVKSGETVLVRIEAQIPPDDETVRPFKESRTGYPSQRIEPALETDLTVDLPKGDWNMDLCATWHGRGDPICWLFRFDVR